MHHSNETFLAKCLQSTIIYLIGQTGFTVTDIGEGPSPGPPLFLDQTERDCPPPPPSKGLDDWGPPLSQGLDPALLKKLLFKSNTL